MGTTNDLKSAQKIRDENLKMHDRDSTIYDFRHSYMRDREFQARFQKDVDFVGEVLCDRRKIRVLDCGAGTGNLSLKFIAKGWDVTAVDISSRMLTVLKSKCENAIESLTVVHSDIDKFLDSQSGVFDVVAFGATLHHLPDYLTSLKLASQVLNAGGVLYVTGEPNSTVQVSRSECLLNRLDEVINVIRKSLCDTSHLSRVLLKIIGSSKDDI